MSTDAKLIDVFDHDDSGMNGDAEQRQKTNSRRHAEVSAGDPQSKQSAERGQRDIDEQQAGGSGLKVRSSDFLR